MGIAKTRPVVAILTPHAKYYGGVEFVNQMLVTMLEEEGFSVRIVSRELLGGGVFFKAAMRYYGLNRLLARYFMKHYAADTDVVICNGEFGLGVSHPAAINSYHGCYYGYAHAVRSFIPEREYRGLMRLADQQKCGAALKFVVAVSRTLAGVLEEQGIPVDAVIDNAIKTDLFKPAQAVSRMDRCIFVGSADYYGKGFDVLEKLADLGVGIDCVTSVRPRDTRLGWLGNIPNKELPQVYARYKAFLLPSRFEGCQLVALEAMACGTPIVMTSVGAGPDIAREIPEFIVDGPWDTVPDKIVERLRRIGRDYESLALRARDYVVRHHAYADWKRKWLETLDLLRRRSGRLRKCQ